MTTAIRKSDTSTAGRIAADAAQAPAASLPSSTAAQARTAVPLFPDVFETPKTGAVGGAAKISVKPSAEESLAELQMLRSLTKGDAQGAQEARDALQTLRAQRERGNKA